MTLPRIDYYRSIDCVVIVCWCKYRIHVSERTLAIEGSSPEEKMMDHLQRGDRHQPPPLPVEYT